MASRLFFGGEGMMTDNDKCVDRYVRITNRERFLIVRALSLLENACDTLGVAYDEYGRTTPCMKEVIALGQVFTRENWMKDYKMSFDYRLKYAVTERHDYLCDEQVFVSRDANEAFTRMLTMESDAPRTLQLLLKDHEGKTLFHRVLAQVGR